MYLFSVGLIICASLLFQTSYAESDEHLLLIVKELQDQLVSMRKDLDSQKTRINTLEMQVETLKNPQSMNEYSNNPIKMQGNERMTKELNSSIGSIRPQRLLTDTDGVVAFQSHLSADLTHIGLRQKIPFDWVTLNLGNAYHGSHGLFIAPRPGIYIFSGSLLAHHSKFIQMTFMKNGASLGGGILASSAVNQGYDQGSATVVAQLKAGDEVWIENTFPDDTAIRATRYSCFMGCLIMEI